MPNGRASPPAIVAEQLTFQYHGADRPAVSGVTFRIDPGGLLLLVGPSGSGKSTLARMLTSLIPRDIPGLVAGLLRIGELDVTAAGRGEAAATVGIVFQDPGSQLVMDRAEDDVAFGLENRAWQLDAMRRRVPEALIEVGLGGFERRRGTRLSGGEQQRLAIAGVLAPWPGVLVLDEPTANLDPIGAARLFERLTVLRDQRTTTIVLIEHRAEFAWPLADLVLALDAAGRPIDAGAPAAVLARSRPRLAREGIWLPAADTVEPSNAAQPAGRRHTAVPGREIVALRRARFGYERGAPVVRDADFSIAAGERVALVGPNGSGKSTLLRLMAGLLRPSAGSVRLDGHDPSRLRPAALADLCGYVFQDPELGFIADTVGAEVAAGLAPSDAQRAAALLEQLGLPVSRFGDRSPYQLSGGEQRRLSVAAALARRPPVLVLDEPTFGQDRRGWEAMAAIVDELVDDGTAVIAATHDPSFAERVANRRIEMADGWIVADDAIGSGTAATSLGLEQD